MNLLRNHCNWLLNAAPIYKFIEHENALSKSLNALKTSGHYIHKQSS